MNSNSLFNLALTSSFIGEDSLKLVTGVIGEVNRRNIPAKVVCVVSTREKGENPGTDDNLDKLQKYITQIGENIPLITVSARRLNRLGDSSDGTKERYDSVVMKAMGILPDGVMMLGNMIIHGRTWCEKIPTLNLHPDLPLSMGGFEGIYWEVIGNWVRNNREEGGGMVHLATPKLDAGTAVAYFRIPLKGHVNEVDLSKLWKGLPLKEEERERLIRYQVALRDQPTDPLFQELRKAEAVFESELVTQALKALALRKISIRDGKVWDEKGNPIVGLDLTGEIVDGRAIWPGQEGTSARRKQRQF